MLNSIFHQSASHPLVRLNPGRANICLAAERLFHPGRVLALRRLRRELQRRRPVCHRNGVEVAHINLSYGRTDGDREGYCAENAKERVRNNAAKGQLSSEGDFHKMPRKYSVLFGIRLFFTSASSITPH